jgi:hypothetical protein
MAARRPHREPGRFSDPGSASGSGFRSSPSRFCPGALQRDLTRWFAVHKRSLNLIGGALLIAVGLYALVDNWGMLALVYG